MPTRTNISGFAIFRQTRWPVPARRTAPPERANARCGRRSFALGQTLDCKPDVPEHPGIAPPAGSYFSSTHCGRLTMAAMHRGRTYGEAQAGHGLVRRVRAHRRRRRINAAPSVANRVRASGQRVQPSDFSGRAEIGAPTTAPTSCDTSGDLLRLLATSGDSGACCKSKNTQ